ncbi:MAG TPA: hypothetical protein VN824_04315 [Puia sp.]|nr:hypothetical protein [Puia sp.]
MHSIEVLSYASAAAPSYVYYEGETPVKKAVAPDAMQARVKYIMTQKASIIP